MGDIESKEEKLRSDSPILHPDKDVLGRADFAKNIAEAIKARNKETQDSFVLAIDAKWGEGKTSVLNLVKHYLNPKDEYNANSKNIVKQLKLWNLIPS